VVKLFNQVSLQYLVNEVFMFSIPPPVGITRQLSNTQPFSSHPSLG